MSGSVPAAAAPPEGEAPLRLGYLASVYPRAVDTAVRNEVTALRARGHRVDTFAIRKAPEAQMVSDFHRAERARTLYVFSDHRWRLPLAALERALRAPGRFARSLALAWRTAPPGLRGAVWQAAYWLEACFLARELLRRDIEHLHAHIAEQPASVAMLASTLSGVPFSMTVHGPYIFTAPARWALGEKIARSAFTACITDFTRSQCMIHSALEHWPRLEIVRCGPDPAFLGVAPPPLPEAPRFVWVGRLCAEKAVPVLLDAARHLAEEGRDFELRMIGDGPLRAPIEARLAGTPLGRRVRLLGWQSPEQIVDHVAASRVMLLPSFAEGLPAVLMEAMALGRPCISTWIAGIPELVEPGRNGWLVRPGSVEALAAAMRDALDAPPERLQAWGAAGRAAVLERHDPAREAGRLAELFARSARGSGTPAAAAGG